MPTSANPAPDCPVGELALTMSRQPLMDRFRSARTDPSLAVLEGFHPLKHALRFGAKITDVVAVDAAKLDRLAIEYAPDVAPWIRANHSVIPEDEFSRLSPVTPSTGVISIAERPLVSLADMLTSPGPAPVVRLENPRNLFNIGAAIRVAAAAGAAGVVTTGRQDPWHPAAIVTATGLQYALPVTRTTGIPRCDRPLVAVDPSGQPLSHCRVPSRALLAFGSERNGLSQELVALADYQVSIPMADGVSSLNLATAVAVMLYSWKLAQ